MMIYAEKAVTTVKVVDVVDVSVQSAKLRASEVYASNPPTLIDLLSVEQWDSFTIDDEPSLVADREGLDCSDGYDLHEAPAAA
jgi:hypothetical protein